MLRRCIEHTDGWYKLEAWVWVVEGGAEREVEGMLRYERGPSGMLRMKPGMVRMREEGQGQFFAGVTPAPVAARVAALGGRRGVVLGGFNEHSAEVHRFVENAATTGASKQDGDGRGDGVCRREGEAAQGVPAAAECGGVERHVHPHLQAGAVH